MYLLILFLAKERELLLIFRFRKRKFRILKFQTNRNLQKINSKFQFLDNLVRLSEVEASQRKIYQIIIIIWARHHPDKRANLLCAYSPSYRHAVGLSALQGNVLLSLSRQSLSKDLLIYSKFTRNDKLHEKTLTKSTQDDSQCCHPERSRRNTILITELK